MVVYISKNNHIFNPIPAASEELGDHISDEESDHNHAETHTTAQIEAGRERILETIRNLFQTQNQVVLMGDWNGLKDFIVGFMGDLGRLDTEPTLTAVRSNSTH